MEDANGPQVSGGRRWLRPLDLSASRVEVVAGFGRIFGESAFSGEKNPPLK